MSDSVKLVNAYTAIKFFTPDCFRRHEFVRLLRHNGVRAVALKDGVLLDRTAFNAITPGWLPVWAWLNKQDINNPWSITNSKAMKERKPTQLYALTGTQFCFLTIPELHIMRKEQGLR